MRLNQFLWTGKCTFVAKNYLHYPGQEKPSLRFTARRKLFNHVISCSTTGVQLRTNLRLRMTLPCTDRSWSSMISQDQTVLFTPSPLQVVSEDRVEDKRNFFPPVLQRCYGCSFDAQEIVHTGHGMLGCCFCFFFFWRERCLPKVSWKSNPVLLAANLRDGSFFFFFLSR